MTANLGLQTLNEFKNKEFDVLKRYENLVANEKYLCELRESYFTPFAAFEARRKVIPRHLYILFCRNQSYSRCFS